MRFFSIRVQNAWILALPSKPAPCTPLAACLSYSQLDTGPQNHPSNQWQKQKTSEVAATLLEKSKSCQSPGQWCWKCTGCFCSAGFWQVFSPILQVVLPDSHADTSKSGATPSAPRNKSCHSSSINTPNKWILLGPASLLVPDSTVLLVKQKC